MSARNQNILFNKNYIIFFSFLSIKNKEIGSGKGATQ